MNNGDRELIQRLHEIAMQEIRNQDIRIIELERAKSAQGTIGRLFEKVRRIENEIGALKSPEESHADEPFQGKITAAMESQPRAACKQCATGTHESPSFPHAFYVYKSRFDEYVLACEKCNASVLFGSNEGIHFTDELLQRHKCSEPIKYTVGQPKGSDNV